MSVSDRVVSSQGESRIGSAPAANRTEVAFPMSSKLIHSTHGNTSIIPFWSPGALAYRCLGDGSAAGALTGSRSGRQVRWRIVAWGTGLQLALSLVPVLVARCAGVSLPGGQVCSWRSRC